MEVQTKLRELLREAAGSRGTVSASVVTHAGAEPQTASISESGDEPKFLAYSITKTFIAALILKLCEEGRMTLDDPLTKWFPRIAWAKEISVRRLLNHTAGIPDYGGIPAYHESVRTSPSTPWLFDRFAAETFEKGLRFEPGKGWAYSNPGYMLIKRIAEDVAGASFVDLVSSKSPERVLSIIGMSITESVDSRQSKCK